MPSWGSRKSGSGKAGASPLVSPRSSWAGGPCPSRWGASREQLCLHSAARCQLRGEVARACNSFPRAWGWVLTASPRKGQGTLPPSQVRLVFFLLFLCVKAPLGQGELSFYFIFFSQPEEDTGVGVILANQIRITSLPIFTYQPVYFHTLVCPYTLRKIFSFEEGKKTREQKKGQIAFAVSGGKKKDKN